MSETARRTELREKSEQLLRGSLKHARTAALAAMLVPLASVGVAEAQITINASGGAVATLNANCNSYTLTVGGFGLPQPGIVSYTIDITSPPTSTINGSFPISPSDALGSFTGSNTFAVGQTVTSQTTISGTGSVASGPVTWRNSAARRGTDRVGRGISRRSGCAFGRSRMRGRVLASFGSG